MTREGRHVSDLLASILDTQRMTVLCRMQGEEADESQAGTTSNQENENEDDKEEDFDASEQWHPNNPYRVQVDLPNVLSDALF